MNSIRRIAMSAVILLLVATPVLAAPSLTAHLTGKEMVPARDTNASGHVRFTESPDQVGFRIQVGNIDNVIWAKLYQGAPGTTGVEVATLYGPVAPASGKASGQLADGALTTAQLTGPLAGHPISDLVSEMKAGNIFVVIATDDGVGQADEKAGDFSTGEIRGQVR